MRALPRSPEGTLVVSIDEKTGIQAKAPTRPDVHARPRKPVRREHEYTRNGTQNLFAALRVRAVVEPLFPVKVAADEATILAKQPSGNWVAAVRLPLGAPS